MTCLVMRGLTVAILLSLHTLPAPGQAATELLRVVNGGSAALEVLRISPDYRARWGHDLLGAGDLDAGEAVSVALPEGERACFFDIEFKIAGRDVAHIWGIDLCQRGTLVLP